MYWKAWYGDLLIELNRTLFVRLRESRALTRLLFGVGVEEGFQKQYWDLTTLIFKKALTKHVLPGQRVLEIGTGDNAILSIFLAKRASISLSAVDIVPQVVASAKSSVVRNGVSIDVRESDIFSNCDGKFDIIFWNIPYVPRPVGLNHQARSKTLTTTNPVRFADAIRDGGLDGTELIRRFISEAPPFLTQNGKVLVGVNTFYVAVHTMYKIIDLSALRLKESVSSWWNTSKVFVLTTKVSEVEAEVPTHSFDNGSIPSSS